MFHKIGTPLYFCNNILPPGPISIIYIHQIVQQKTGLRYVILHLLNFYILFKNRDVPSSASGSRNCTLLKVETPDFIPPNFWPPNSPDLNPVDYKIWGMQEKRVYKTSIKDVDELRRRIAEEWDKLDQCIVNKAVGIAKETSSVCGCRWRTV